MNLRTARATHLRALSTALCAYATIVSGCGGESTTNAGPDFEPGIQIVSGQSVTDTVDAILAQPLVFRVIGDDHLPVKQTFVRFTPTEITTTPGMFRGYTTRLSTNGLPATAVWGVTDTALTDQNGIVRVMVRLGEKEGPGGVIATVRCLLECRYRTLKTSATYTVNAGAPTSVTMSPQDTAVYVGAPVALRATVRDRHDNVRTDPVTYSTPDARARVESSTFTGTTVGRIKVMLAAGTGRDSAAISVVPKGTVAAYAGIESSAERVSMYQFDLDGRNFRLLIESSSLPGSLAHLPMSWTPDGKSIVFSDAVNTGTLRVLDPATGFVRRLPTPANEMYDEDWPAVSRDGAWVYFFGTDFIRSGIFRISMDGASIEPLFGRSPSTFPLPPAVFMPSPSPDGRNVAFYDDRGTLQVLDLETRQVSSIGFGIAPAWSPRGDQIAFIKAKDNYYPFVNGPIMLVRPDGTGLRQLTTGPYFIRIQWSPDAKYLIGTHLGYVIVVDATTGEAMPLTINAVNKPFVAPAWKP